MSRHQGYPYFWATKTRMADRWGEALRVVKWLRDGHAEIKFWDGFTCVASIHHFRKRSERTPEKGVDPTPEQIESMKRRILELRLGVNLDNLDLD